MSPMRARDAAAIRTAVRDILASVGARPDLSTLGDSDSLLGGGVIDSMAMVGLVGALEERFHVTISDTELVPEHFDTVQAIVALVSSKAGES